MASIILAMIIPALKGHITHFINMSLPHSHDHNDRSNKDEKEQDQRESLEELKTLCSMINAT